MPRVLLIRFSSLGDVVLALPVAASLRAALPGAEVVFLTRAVFSPLLQGQSGVDRVAVLEEGRTTLADVARLVRGLGEFDLAIDLHRTGRSRVALQAARARRKVAYRKDALLRRLWAAGWMRGRMSREPAGVVGRYLATLRAAGIDEPAVTVPTLALPPGAAEAARRTLAAAGVGDPDRIAVLVPGARWPNKRWTRAGFAAVGTGLREREGLEPVIAGDAADLADAATVGALIRGGAAVMAGRTSLVELAGVLAAARVVVANDSGPAHLAAAVGTPVVTLFGPTHEAFGFAPCGERVRVVSRDLECRPCTVHGGRRCLRGHRACLEEIGADEVLAAARELLAPGGPPPASAA